MAGMFEYYPACCRLPSYPKTEPFTKNPNTWKRSCLTCAKNRRTHRSSIQDSQGQVASNSPSYRVPTNTDQSSKSGELDSTIWTTKLNVSVTQDPFVFKFGCEQKRWLFFFENISRANMFQHRHFGQSYYPTRPRLIIWIISILISASLRPHNYIPSGCVSSSSITTMPTKPMVPTIPTRFRNFKFFGASSAHLKTKTGCCSMPRVVGGKALDA